MTTDRSWLDSMDQRRYEAPKATLQELERAASLIPKSLHPLFLGVCGSTYRNLAGLEEIEQNLARAEEHICLGIWIAGRQENGAAKAGLILRRGYVIADRGQHAEALHLAERASAIYERADDQAGRGKALADQGMYLYYLGQKRESIEAYLAALRLLPESEKSNRCSAFHAIGVCYLDLNQPEAALSHAKLAEPLIPSEPFEARLFWFQGNILAKLSRYQQAEQKLGHAVEILRNIHYGDAALASVELVRLQLIQGRQDDAWKTVCAIRDLVAPLSSNPMVASALLELMRDGCAGLSITRAEAARSLIRKARERQDWRSLSASG